MASAHTRYDTPRKATLVNDLAIYSQARQRLDEIYAEADLFRLSKQLRHERGHNSNQKTRSTRLLHRLRMTYKLNSGRSCDHEMFENGARPIATSVTEGSPWRPYRPCER